LMSFSKVVIPKLSKTLSEEDVKFLVQMLNEKQEKLRYNSFLLLQASSQMFPYLYQYWNELEDKLSSENSYHRSLGIMLIAENVRWDRENRFAKTILGFLGCFNSGKFINSRQVIQGLATISNITDKHDEQIKRELANLQLSQFKASQQKLLAKDILNVLRIINSKTAH